MVLKFTSATQKLFLRMGFYKWLSEVRQLSADFLFFYEGDFTRPYTPIPSVFLLHPG